MHGTCYINTDQLSSITILIIDIHTSKKSCNVPLHIITNVRLDSGLIGIKINFSNYMYRLLIIAMV